MKIALFPGQLALRYPFRAAEDDQEGGEAQPVTNGGEADPEPEPDPEPQGAETDAAPETGSAPDGDDQIPEGDLGDDALATAEGGEEEDPAEPRRRDWGLKRRVDKLTAQAKAAEARAAEAEARAKTLEELYSKPENDRTDAERESIRQAVRSEVSQEVRAEEQAKRLNQAADKLFDDGAKAYPKTWEKRVTDIRELFGDDLRQRPDFLEAVTDLDNAPAVWHELGSDPETMDRLLQLPPARMGIELAKLSGKLSVPKPRQVSAAPTPIRPLSNTGTVEELPLDDDRVSMEEFNRRREAQWAAANRH